MLYNRKLKSLPYSNMAARPEILLSHVVLTVDKIPEVISVFLGSSSSIKLMSTSAGIDRRRKHKMTAEKPEIVVSHVLE